MSGVIQGEACIIDGEEQGGRDRVRQIESAFHRRQSTQTRLRSSQTSQIAGEGEDVGGVKEGGERVMLRYGFRACAAFNL